MTLKINYLDTQKGLSKNTALFLSNDTKISEFRGIFDDKINQKIVNYLKKSEKLKENKIESNLISIPCVEIFERQSKKYKENILGENPRILIEASTSFGWYKFLRQNDTIISIDTFGESGKGNELFNYFGFESKKITSNLLKKYFSDNT